MEIYEKLIKQISEAKYLNTENSYRYRPIMRLFYRNYEQLEYWLYKEDVYNALKDNEMFKDYTLEECERDLETLTEWKNLSHMQDTKDPVSLEDFKIKKFRYKMTEYAVEIERLTIDLENMEIKTASLEPKLFDRIRISLSKFENIDEVDDETINEIWNELNDDFTKLNENYQDYLSSFNNPKSEEMMQNVLFLEYKNKVVKYLREFIRGYQKNIYYIKDSIDKINNDDIENILNSLNNHLKKTPILNNNFDFEQYKETNRSKLKNIFKWFIGGSSSISEGEKLMSTTDNIIVTITKYANSLIELHGNMTSRKEEYKYLIKLFDKLDTIEDASSYASVIFGIQSVRHFIGDSNINTDSIIDTYSVPPISILLESRKKERKEKIAITPIVDKTIEKKKQLEEYRKKQEENKNLLRKLIKNKKIILKGNINLSKTERRYIQKLIASSSNKETEFGLNYYIKKEEGKCTITSEDGKFIMNSLEIIFEGEL